jgi:hypothetical protein
VLSNIVLTVAVFLLEKKWLRADLKTKKPEAKKANNERT